MQIRTIDYVFIKKDKIKVVGYLEMPESSNIDSYMGNPCKNHPSDHYSLVFDLKMIWRIFIYY